MSEQLLVSHTGRGVFRRLGGLLIVLLFFLALFGAYLNDDLRQLLSKNNARGPVTTGGPAFFAAAISAILIDMVFALLMLRRGRPALLMDGGGFGGRIFYRWRTFRWDQLDQISNEKGRIGLKPKPKGLARLIDIFPTRFGPVNATNAIYFSLHAVDKSRDEILAFIRERAPGIEG